MQALSFLAIVPLVASVVDAECVAVSQKIAFQRATAVFMGRVIDIRDVASSAAERRVAEKVPTVVIDPTGPQVITFRAIRAWKGSVTDEMMAFVFRQPPEGMGYTFKVGAEYVVYVLDDVSGQWPAIRRLSAGTPVYDLGMCLLRVRTDITQEKKRLGPGASVPSKGR